MHFSSPKINGCPEKFSVNQDWLARIDAQEDAVLNLDRDAVTVRVSTSMVDH